MLKRLLLNLGLAVMVAALVLVVWLEPGIDRDAGSTRLTALAVEEIARIMIQRSGHDEIVLERGEHSQWRLSAPLQAPANEFRIEPLLQIVNATSHARFAAAPGELAGFGLDPPRAVLRIGTVDIAFGDTEPIDHRRYVQVGNIVHLVDDNYLDRLELGPASFVSNRLLPAGSHPVRLVLPDFTIEQDAQGRWRIEPEREISMDALNQIVDAWTHANALLVQPYDGDVAQGKISITLQGSGQPLEYHIIESEADLVLALPEAGLVYHLGSDQGSRMLKPTPDPDALLR